MRLSILAVLLAAAAYLASQPAPREQVGPLPDGGFLLSTGWRIKPAGRQVPLDTLPMSTALSPDGKYLLVLNAGYKPPSVIVLDATTMQEVSRTPVADAWLGLTFSPDGKRVYVGGGSQASVFEFSFSEGKLAPSRTFVLVPEKDRKPRDFIGDVAVRPDGKVIYAADLFNDSIRVINSQNGAEIGKFSTGRRPYRMLFHPDGQSIFITSWADGTVYHHLALDGQRLGMMRLGPHTTDIVWRARKSEEKEEEQIRFEGRLFVSAANSNNVYVVGVTEGKGMQRVETINVGLTSRNPLGMTPSALAMNADQSRLYVVCSDANAVAVTDISQERSLVLGFVPTAWYPTAARSMSDGRLVILNGRGSRSFPNPAGPNPSQSVARSSLGIRSDQYVGVLQTGSASVVDPFDDAQLEEYTKQVVSNSPYRDEYLDRAPIPAGGVVPASPGAPTPIKHVIYIVKENRTYDQVFGALGKGNGDPSLNLFTEDSSPNHHKLAREFVLFDNFYVNADVSADGHHWSTAAIAPDYVQKLWPNSYASRRKLNDYQGGDPTSLPPAGYLWTQAAAAGLTFRNYGYQVTNTPTAAPTGERQVTTVRDSVLARSTSMEYRGFDMDYPDVDRAKIFIKEFTDRDEAGTVPRLIFIRLGNDHTSGTTPGRIAPLSAMADNDYAFGMIVETITKSKIWPSAAIFVIEDDAQNGPDHVDSHRSIAFVISPYTRTGAVDSTMYNTTSMLRTMELILGLRPMTHFDAGARPMVNAFSTKPDTRPYQVEKPRIPLDTRNPQTSATASRSAKLDFSEADQIDDDELNDILWRAIRNTEPPAPVRSYFSGRAGATGRRTD